MTIPYFIDTQDLLEELCHHLGTASAIAVDTEFVWMRTYFPQLGIIQLATSRTDAYIVDCTTISDPSPLRAVLENPAIVKIFHDAHQDITIINRYTGGDVRNVFDTQRAAGFTGRIRNLSLEKLVREMTGVQLAKSETRTNWLKRPLDPEQVEYALDDVRYLPEIRVQLIEQAASFGNESYLHLEMEPFDSIIPFDFQESIERQFRKSAGRIAARGRNRAWRLVCWLEEEARLRDVPRDHILKKEILPDLALTEATSVEELRATGLLSPKFIDRYGERIAAVLESDAAPSKELVKSLQRPASDSNEMSMLIQVFHAFCNSLARERGIDPTLLFNKSEVSEFTRRFAKNRHFKPMDGWRGDLINEPAELFLTGKLHLTYRILEENAEQQSE